MRKKRNKRKLLKASTKSNIKRSRNKRKYSKKYLAIRNYVIARDLWTCQLCDKSGLKLQVHHIALWSQNITLRQNKRNLISLCKTCHNSIRNKEQQYAATFKRKVARNTSRYRRDKLTHEEFMVKMREQQKLPDSFEEYQYKTESEVEKKKKYENYLRVTWRGIKYRITNPNCASYPRYGGRGITMDKGWLSSFDKFKAYIIKELGERPEGHSIDRIDNDGNYEPGNVRWATAAVQKQNNSQTKMDQAMVEAVFILYHKYKFKQVQIMNKFGMNNPTGVRNIVKFQCWHNVLNKYKPIVKEDSVIKKIEEYDTRQAELAKIKV